MFQLLRINGGPNLKFFSLMYTKSTSQLSASPVPSMLPLNLSYLSLSQLYLLPFLELDVEADPQEIKALSLLILLPFPFLLINLAIPLHRKH